MGNLILLFSAEIILFLFAFTFTEMDILAPSTIMSAMFIVSTAFALASAENWRIDYSLKTVAILISGILVFIVTEMIVKSFSQKKQKTKNDSSTEHSNTVCINNIVLFLLLVFNSFVLVWYYIEIKNIVGFRANIGLVFSSYRNLGVDDLAGKTGERISGLLNQLLKLVKVSGYIGIYTLLNKKLFAVNAKGYNNSVLLILVCLTSLGPNVMVASRGGILMYISNILIIYYILWHQKKGWNRNLSWKVIRIGIISIVAGIPVFYYSSSLIGRKNTLNIFDYVSTYIGGSIYLFDLYIKNPIPQTTFGEESLFNLLKFLNVFGIGGNSTSYNLESRYLGNIQSNVYTFFRRPLHDFGLEGMYVFTILISILFSYIYYNKIKNKERNFKNDCWVLVYGYLYYWVFVSSILQYSVSYISAGCFITLAILLLMYWVLIKVRIVIKH